MAHQHPSSGSRILDELKLQAWLAKAEARHPSTHHEVSTLAQMRDELRLKVELGKLEARDEMDALDDKWRKLEHAVKRSAEDVGDDVKKLLADLREGYERIRKS